MANQISNQIKTTKVLDVTAAGTTDINSASVDMANFEGVRFTVGIGVITSTAVTVVKAATSSDDSNWNDLLGTAISFADDDDAKMVIIDIWRPLERYLRITVDRGTANAVIDFAIAEQYGPRTLPTTDTAADMPSVRELHTSPIEGTA